MKYYLKKTVVPFVYTLIMACIAFFFPWDKLPLFVSILIAIVNIAMYAVVVVITSFKDGETAMRLLHSNDAGRRRIIETGEDIKIDRNGEYKAYKGFLIGFFVCIPMVVLLILHTFLWILVENDVCGRIASIIYKGYTILFNLAGQELVGDYCYLALCAIPLITCISGIPYILGAKKMQRVYKDIKEQQKEIYGE